MQRNMSNQSILPYKFKPFEFTVLEKNVDPLQRPFQRIGEHVVCNNTFLYSYSKFYPDLHAGIGFQMPPYTYELWKYSFDLGEWKIMKTNIPQKFTPSLPILSGSLIITYGVLKISNKSFRSCIYFVDLKNELKEDGMKFEEIQVSGDVPNPLFEGGVVMDGKYIYAIGGQWLDTYEMDVHRLNLSTKKWELLHKLKSQGDGQEPDPRFQHKAVFYKDRIYIFGGVQERSGNIIYYGFSKMHLFDVTTKQWKCLQAKQDIRMPDSGYPDKFCNKYFQCPKNTNFVYIYGGLTDAQCNGAIWRVDLDNLQWIKLTSRVSCTLNHYPINVTPSGRLCCYGGADITECARGLSSFDITSAWMKIPKLKVICWEAMVHYFKSEMLASSDECLKKLGLPQEFYERIIEARRTK